MNYEVGYFIKEDKVHGIDSADVIIAKFEAYIYAEDFVLNCMPVENRNRFFIRCTFNGNIITF